MARRFASTTSLDTTLYRQLLRLGRALDRSAIARAMLVAAPEQLFDRQTQAVISLPQLDGASAEAVERIAAYNSGEFYAPSSQSAFRHCVVSRSAPVRNDRVDVGLSALRAMGAAAAGAEAISAARPPLPWCEAEAPRQHASRGQLDGVSAEAFIFWAPPRMACADAKRGTRRV